MAYRLLNALFHALHFAVIVFTALGWMVPSLRSAHLVFILLTLGSWYVLGLWLGIGYCPITDWHWRIKEALGEGRPAGTYIHWIASRLGLHWSASAVDRSVLIITLSATAISAALNAHHWTGRE